MVVGYGAFGQRCGPSLTSGILSRAIGCHGQAVMLQTTAAVQAGASGGAVVRAGSGELLGKPWMELANPTLGELLGL